MTLVASHLTDPHLIRFKLSLRIDIRKLFSGQEVIPRTLVDHRAAVTPAKAIIAIGL
jgi:hypothetical protein